MASSVHAQRVQAIARGMTDEVRSSRAGLEYWAHRVLVESEKVGSHFDPDAVHDLRVALRRCRSKTCGRWLQWHAIIAAPCLVLVTSVWLRCLRPAGLG
jgi:hypothetical protein